MSKQDSSDNIRGIMAFPNIQEFYNELVDRLYMVLDQFFLQEKFTILVNALPRDHDEGTKIYMPRYTKNIPLTYGGIPRIRELLEEGNYVQELDKDWNLLKNYRLEAVTSKVSVGLFDEYQELKFELKDIDEKGNGELKVYFQPELEPNEGHTPLTEPQMAEYNILKYHFDLYSYRYLSIPLIQFAEFDGIVHIILSENDYQNNFLSKESKSGEVESSDNEPRKRRLNERVVGNVIKAFSREYEGLILDWDIVGGAKLKQDAFLDSLDRNKFYSERGNEILKQLKYYEYYTKHRQYFEDRLRYSKQVPLDLRAQYRQIAIIHILLDSYAHNISAHSLTALEWWFRQRADLLRPKQNADGSSPDQGNKNGQPHVALLEKDNLSIPLDNEIHPLLRFLLDKGAFWTGLTRDNSFGGRIISLYNVLWRDFINNPLYLGTIAFTEGIVKININITLLKPVGHEENVKFKKEVILDGNFAKIDLTQFVKAKNEKERKYFSHFVEEGDHFHAIKEKLRDYKAFFPGGIVGQHAFFTILETELRNVKHHTPQELDRIRKEGLTLNISIEDYEVAPVEGAKQVQYFKIGVWLKHPIPVNKDLMLLRPGRLYRDIIEEESFLPILGGTTQDKVCAAMLFNNSFASVENQTTPRDKRFYPWIKAAGSPTIEFREGDTLFDYELSARRMFDDEFASSRHYFDNHFPPFEGYFKKFFNVWKGEFIYDVNDAEEFEKSFESENISRFKFIRTPEIDNKLFRQVREQGIIRIIHQPTKDHAAAYHQWLNRWLAIDKTPGGAGLLELSIESNVAAQLACDNGGIAFRSESRKDLLLDVTPMQEINLVHRPEQHDQSGNKAVRYRNHGIMMTRFMQGKKLNEVQSMDAELAAELLEVLGTSVCIFDNRVAARFKQLDSDIFAEQLRCVIHEEDHDKWESEKQKDFFRYNFLVVHLSFIESFKDENGEKKYDERDVKNFIDQEILNGREIPDNFMLVVTTGRGRTNWWEKLRNLARSGVKPGETAPPAYTSFVTFRPVESLTAAIENALTISDDVELKYRLVKVLFGS